MQPRWPSSINLPARPAFAYKIASISAANPVLPTPSHSSSNLSNPHTPRHAMQSLTFLPLLLALSQFLATLVLPAAACDVSVGQQVQIYVYRDQTTDGAPLSSFPQYYGCLRINKRAGSSPWINVRSGAFSSSECAQFKVIEGGGAYGTDTCSVRLQALCVFYSLINCLAFSADPHLKGN